MPSLRLDGTSLHFRQSGAGSRAVLLLHAFPLHAGMWEPQLASLGVSFRPIAIDYRGMGRSGPAPDVNTMERLAGDALAVLRALGLRQAAVVGTSMGGYLALELLRQAPQVVRGLVLCDTKATPDTTAAKDAREAFAATALEKGLGWVADDFAPKLLRPRPASAHLARVRQLIAECTAEGVAACQRGMARRPDSVPTLGQIRCPTLTVCGAEDQITPFGELQRIQQTVRGARLAIIPAAGHLPNLESPDAFDAAVGEFLSRLF